MSTPITIQPCLAQYLEDFNECKAIMGYRYPETLVEEFLAHGVTDKSTKILDLACGPGNVAYLVRSMPQSCTERCAHSASALT